MNRSFRSVLVGALLTAGLVMPTTAEAQAAPCVWQRAELPVPAGHSGTEVWGYGGDYVVGTTSYQQQPVVGIRWHNRQPTVLTPPTTDPATTAEPRDVNRNGTVVGRLRSRTSMAGAYITRLDGTSQVLGTPPGLWVEVAAINDFGDVVGTVNTNNGDESNIVVWPGSDYTQYRVYGKGLDGSAVARGIDNGKRVVTADGTVIHPSGLKWRLSKPAGTDSLSVATFEDRTPVGWVQNSSNSHQAVVWNLNGSVRYTVPGLGYSANYAGTALGTSTGQDTKIWRAGQSVAVPVPTPRAIMGRSFVTGKDTVLGTYFSDFDNHAAEWSCV